MYLAKTAWSILEVYLDLLRKWCTWPRLLQVYFKYTWSSTYLVKYVSIKAPATGAEAVLPRSILEVYLDQVRKLFISPRQLQVYLENTWRSTYLAKQAWSILEEYLNKNTWAKYTSSIQSRFFNTVTFNSVRCGKRFGAELQKDAESRTASTC